MFDRGSPWDGQYHRRSPQEPKPALPAWDSLDVLARSGSARRRRLCLPQWEPGNKGNSIALTIIHQVIPFAVRKAIAVLHRDDRDNSARSLDVLLRDVGQRDQANLAFVRS